MDNICHTLVGAAFAEAGLKRRTPLASATLMIAANLPDLDVGVFLTGVPSVEFRRGWTHGVLAQVVLPPLLAVAAWAWGRRRDEGSPPRLPWLVALSYLGVLSHVGLDYLNNYGVRLLMPWSGRWFYGDTLFIIDPWLWTVLGVGVWLARKRGHERPARVAVGLAAIYIVAMLASAQAARQFVIDAWVRSHGAAPRGLMVGPRPVTPVTRDVIVDAGDHYERGRFSWFPVAVTFDPDAVPKGETDPVVAVARQAPPMQSFLVWSRFPLWTSSADALGTWVTVGDMRFSALSSVLGRGRFETSVLVAPDARPATTAPIR